MICQDCDNRKTVKKVTTNPYCVERECCKAYLCAECRDEREIV